MTYTVLKRDGEVRESGLTLTEAAQSVLWHDGHEFEIRADGTAFELWVSTFSRNSGAWTGLSKSQIFSLNADEGEATVEIFNSVIRNANWWSGQRVVTDEDYAAEMAELTAQDTDE